MQLNIFRTIKTSTRIYTSTIIFLLFSSVTVAKQNYSFKLLKTYKYTQSTQVLHYQHEKSGAHLVYFKNNDTNRAFNLAFQTRSYDDVGLPHIFEHSCLAGSQKYPSSNLFFQMGAQTYNTFMNAMTYQNFTCYPMGSLSEEQLFANLDVYVNGVFHPIVLTEQNDLKREAVRLVLESEGGSISATGAVYNELLGVMADKNSVNYYNLRKLLYPNSTDSFITGGRPEDILNVSWQAVKDFHKKYYVPSNMVIYLYGKLNLERFLEYFDSQLSEFEKTKIDLSDLYYKEWEGFKEQTVEFPVSSSAQTEDSCIFNYAFTLPDADYKTFNDLRVFDNYISKESSWLTTTLKEKFPKADYYCGFNNLCRLPYYQFTVENINETDKEELFSIIKQAIDKFCAEKLDKKYIEVFANDFKMSTILDEENPDGVSELRSAGLLWSISDNPVNIVEYKKELLKLPNTSTPQSILATVKKYFISPKQSVILITKPVAGLSEAKAWEQEEFFADKKASMSKEEISALISENKAYDKWLSDNQKINLIDKIKVVSAKNLPEEAEEAQIVDDSSNGFRVIYGENKKAQYIDAEILFNMSAVPKEYLQPIMLYFKLLESLPTKKFTLDALEEQEMQTFYSNAFYTSIINLKSQFKEGGSALYPTASFMCLNEKITDAFAIEKEILLNTELTDFDTIRSLAGRFAKSKKEEMASNPSSLAFEIAFIQSHPQYTARHYAIRYEAWDYLERVSKMRDEELKNEVQNIRTGLTYLFNKNNLTLTIIGDKKQIDKSIKHVKDFCENLSDEPVQMHELFTEHTPLPASIGVIVSGSSNYNVMSISMEDLSLEYDAKFAVVSSIIDDKFMFPVLRYKYGAYGAGSDVSANGIYLYTYRDPQIKNTFEVLSSTAQNVKSMELTEDELDGYITAVYSNLAEPESEASKIQRKINKILYEDFEENQNLRHMHQVKSVTVKDIEEFTKYLTSLNKKGLRVTVGGAEQIYANNELFDLIITDFIK